MLRDALQRKAFVRMGLNPHRSLHRALAIASRRDSRTGLAGRHHPHHTGCEPQPDFIQPHIAVALRHRLCQLTQHHQLWQRWQTGCSPDLAIAVNQVDDAWRKMEREALVATDMVVMRAHEFIAWIAQQHRACHQFMGDPTHPVAKAALADI